MTDRTSHRTSHRTPHRIALGLAATCLAAGAVSVAGGGGASARVADHEPGLPTPAAPAAAATPATERPDDRGTGSRRGLASVSAPYVPGVWHVPADVLLTVGPDGGSRYVGPEASMFNGPTGAVGRRVDAWWAEQLAAGLTPEQADRRLARLGR